ncbi:MAG: hypothetical protein JSV19_03160 [Phycisphaerales bacterium]|nr:MAG: hypothetical protein JSV19_03160 [Phycisphaerales bacterium]
MDIEGFSTALYSTWLHVPGHRLLIDAGDGAAAGLTTACRRIDIIAITHQHRDHVAGLLEVLSWSAFERPCHVLYPAGSDLIEAVRQTAPHQGIPCADNATWTPLEPGQALTLPASDETVERRTDEANARASPPTIELVAFRVPHTVGNRADRALGYALVEGGHVRLAVTGDARAEPIDLPGPPDILFRDCTYLHRQDTREAATAPGQHGLLDDVLDLGAADPPSHLVLYHLDERYRPDDTAPWIESACRKRDLPFPVSVLWPGRYTADATGRPVWTPRSGP